MAMWRAIIVYIVLSTLIVQHFVSGQTCQINDLKNINDGLKNCGTEVKNLVLNTTSWQSIPQNLINQTQSIKSIDVSNTSLSFFNESLNLCQWPHLTFINAEHNNINELRSNVLKDCHQLNTLSFANNQINQIFENAFHGLSSLKQLDLSMNKIQSLSAEIFKPLAQLKILRLNNNRIGAIDKDHFAHNVNLQILDLSYNLVAAIEEDSFSKLKELRTLDMECNPDLNAIDLKKMEKLNDVIISNASLLQLYIPKSVVTVDANFNRIEHLSIETNSNLERLSLKYNHLRNINDLAIATNLTYLDVSNNDISDIDFAQLKNTNISTIVLLENPIHKFDVSSLMNLPKLKVLEMSTSILDNQTLTELLNQSKKKMQLQDPNREIERKGMVVTLPPVTPVAQTTTSTNRIDTSSGKPIVNEVATVTPNPNSKNINQILKRLQKLESFIANRSVHAYGKTDDHSEIVENLASLRTMIICTIIAFVIFVALQIAIFTMKHWRLSIVNMFSPASNNRIPNGRRNPFCDSSMDPIIEENL